MELTDTNRSRAWPIRSGGAVLWMTAELDNKGCKYSEDQQFNMWFWRYVSKLNIFLKCASGSGVEHHLAKVGAAGSNPVSRFFNSWNRLDLQGISAFSFSEDWRQMNMIHPLTIFRFTGPLKIGTSNIFFAWPYSGFLPIFWGKHCMVLAYPATMW